MKKKLITTLKVLAGSALALFAGLCIWANWNPPAPAQKLEPKAFALYDLGNVKDAGEFAQVNTKLQQTKGIAATSLRPMDKLISVVYYTGVISQADIMQKISEWTSASITTHELKATGPTCPVAGMMGAFALLKRTLCIRS